MVSNYVLFGKKCKNAAAAKISCECRERRSNRRFLCQSSFTVFVQVATLDLFYEALCPDSIYFICLELFKTWQTFGSELQVFKFLRNIFR